MSDTTTRGIRIRVTPSYVPEQSDPDEDRYFFAYHIVIENQGEVPAQLVSRHWIITDGDGSTSEVRGLGVVGLQPVLAPGGRHEYSSACPLQTPVGSMQGSFQMVTAGGEHFDALIAPFSLAMPGIVN